MIVIQPTGFPFNGFKLNPLFDEFREEIHQIERKSLGAEGIEDQQLTFLGQVALNANR